MELVMMMENHIVVNVQKILWVIVVNEVCNNFCFIFKYFFASILILSFNFENDSGKKLLISTVF